MVAATEVKLRQCDHCGKEFKPRTPDHRFCQRQCRWDYNNALKFETPPKQVDGMYTPLHASETAAKPKVVAITPTTEVKREKTEPDVLLGYVKLMAENSDKQTALLERQVSSLERIEKKIETMDNLDNNMLLQILTAIQGLKSVPFNTPFIPKLEDDDDDPLPVVEVKQAAKQDGNVQATNFLNSIMALNG